MSAKNLNPNGSKAMVKKTIVSYAVLTVNYKARNADYIDNFIPFIATLIYKKHYEEINVNKVRKDFRNEFGLDIPYHPMVAILNRAKKHGLIKLNRYRQKWQPVTEKIEELEFGDVANDHLRKQEKVIQHFIEFAKTNFNEDITYSDAESTLLAFLSVYDLEIFTKKVSLIPENMSRSKLNYCLFKFIQHANQADPEIFDFLVDISIGHVLVDTVFNCHVFEEENSEINDLKELEVYLDSDLIFMLLGIVEEERKSIYEDFITTLLDLNAQLYVFEHNYDEAQSILQECLNWVENPRYDPSKASLSAKFFVANGYDKVKVQETILKLPKVLEKYKITVVPGPSPNELERYQEDEAKLKKYIIETYRGSNPFFNETEKELTLWKDVKSLSYVHKLRKGLKPQIISKANCVFVTTNSGLAHSNKRFEELEKARTFCIPICLTDLQLGTMLWLQSPSKVEVLNKKKLMAECYAALQPNEILLKKYVKQLDKLYGDALVTNEQYYLLRTYQGAMNLLQDKTMGDIDNFTDKMPLEIYEEMQNQIRGEEQSNYLDERQEHGKTRGQLQEQIERTNEINNQKLNAEKSNENAICKLTNVTYAVLIVLLVTITTLVTLFSNLSNRSMIFKGVLIAGAIVVGVIGFLWQPNIVKQKIQDLIKKTLF
ncbi:hypothetical protein MFMK1_000051 [Metallumcola ferriviriculae]|uniref:Uncharacterized protein n=1 Tax=Metallumcola ferriviriculae TaxID=3039180 RepID=A0AAU0UJH1_9FIRM|nr:hypothetical protein MFMK1_000051 [Desulfitibacteraceae bacterium MK1]